jgi:hypothetical protein
MPVGYQWLLSVDICRMLTYLEKGYKFWLLEQTGLLGHVDNNCHSWKIISFRRPKNNL